MTDVANLLIKADSRSVKTTTGDLGRMSTASTGLTSSLKKLAPALGAVLSVHLMKKLAGEAAEFGTAMAEVSTLLDDMDQMPRITKEAKALAREYGGAPTDQAKAFYQAISAGASTAAEATDVLTVANKLAVGGVTDVTTAVDGLTTIINAYGLDSSDATAVADGLFVAMKAGKTTVGELSSSIGLVASVTNVAGVSFEETLASISALTTAGVSTSESVTLLKGVMTSLIRPTEDAKDVAESLGLEFDLAAIQTKGFQGFLQDLQEKVGDNQQAMADLFPNVRAVQGIFSLTGAQAELFTETMDNMDVKSGELEKAFGKMSAEFEFRLTALAGKFTTTGIRAGDFFIEALGPGVDHMNENYDAYIAKLEEFGSAFGDVTETVVLSFNVMGEQLAISGNAMLDMFELMFSNIETGGLDTVEVLSIAFGGGLMAITTGTQAAAISLWESFRELSVRIVHSGEEQERKLRVIDESRRKSLDNVFGAYDANINQLFDLMERQREERTELSFLTHATNQQADAAEGLSHATDLMTDAEFKAWERAQDLRDGIVELTLAEKQNHLTTDDWAQIMGEADKAAREFTDQTIATREYLELLGLEMDETGVISKKVVEDISIQWEDLQGDFSDFFIQFRTHGSDAFDSLAKSFQGMLEKMVADWIASGLTRLVSSFFGSIGGGGGGGGGDIFSSVISGGASAVGGSVIPSIVASVTGGATTAGVVGGAGTGIAAAEAAVAAQTTGGVGFLGGASNFLKAIPGWGWALAGIATAALIFNKKATPSANAGLLTHSVPGAKPEELFAIDAFDSGFAPVGFQRRTSRDEALAVIDGFRTADSILTDLARSAGLKVSFDASDFSGLNEKGMGSGAFLGFAGEEGQPGKSVESQLDAFTKEWFWALQKDNPTITGDQIRSVIDGGNSSDILNRAGQISANNQVQGSFASGIGSIPFDGFRAELHAGERVLTAQQASAQDKMSSNMDLAVDAIQQMMLTVSVNSTAVKGKINDWDKRGLPAERV